MGHRAVPASAIVCFGGNDLRVADHAAELMLDGVAEWLVVSGGIAHRGDLLRTRWSGTECDAFTQAILSKGVSASRILAEPAATNTAENLRYSHQILTEAGIRREKLLLVCKPHMQRRILATAAVELPFCTYHTASFTLDLNAYCNAEFSKDYVAQLMVGDLQRIEVYGSRGYSAPQYIPDDVRAAWQDLIDAGYDRHLVRG
jgi:hypothetical protein